MLIWEWRIEIIANESETTLDLGLRRGDVSMRSSPSICHPGAGRDPATLIVDYHEPEFFL